MQCSAVHFSTVQSTAVKSFLVAVLLSAHIERFSVSRMRNFFLDVTLVFLSVSSTSNGFLVYTLGFPKRSGHTVSRNCKVRS